MTEYAVVIEDAGNNFSAYVPDLPGCVATGSSVDDVKAAIATAVAFHLRSLREHGEQVPLPTSQASTVQVA